MFDKRIKDKKLVVFEEHKDNSITVVKNKITIHEWTCRAISLFAPFLFAILSINLQEPNPESEAWIIFLFNYYPWIIFAISGLAFIMVECKTYILRCVFDLLNNEETQNRIRQAEDGVKIQELQNELAHQTGLYGELVKEIATDKIDLHNLCQIMCTYLLRHVDNNNKGSYSISIYLKDGDQLSMPAHISLNSPDIPKLYMKKENVITVFDEGICEYYFCKSICGMLNKINAIDTAKKIKSTFHFKNNAEKKNTCCNQYINLVVKISSTKSYLIEVIAHKNSNITVEKELLDFAGRLLPPYGLILLMIDNVAYAK